MIMEDLESFELEELRSGYSLRKDDNKNHSERKDSFFRDQM